MTDVSFHPDADAEVLEASEWYLERSYAAAAGFVRELEHACERIAEAPERYPQTRFGRRRFVMPNYPYDVIYRVAAGAVEIIAVAHHARKPGYWRRR